VRPVWAYTYLQIGHCLWALLSAVTGGLLARLFFGGMGARSSDARPEAPVAAPPAPAAPRYWWLKPAGFALAGFGAIALVLVAGSTLDPSIWAGTIFVLTVGLICLACVGACLGRGRHREIWLGAALFGGGFMVAVFARSPAAEGWPSHPTVELLNAIRTRWRSSGGATPPSSIVAESNTRILQALEQPVTACGCRLLHVRGRQFRLRSTRESLAAYPRNPQTRKSLTNQETSEPAFAGTQRIARGRAVELSECANLLGALHHDRGS
jgi:hypothetical protein